MDGFVAVSAVHLHGGLSTGPRTPAGKERLRQAARRTMLERSRVRRGGAAT